MNWKLLWRKKDVLTPREAASKRRAYIFMVCLFCSALFWLFTKLSQESAASFEQQVLFTGFPENQIGLSQSDSTLSFTLEGTGLRLIQARLALSRQIFHFDVDEAVVLHPGDPEQRVVTAEMLSSRLERGLDGRTRVVSMQPDSISLDLAPARRKLVPVNLHANIRFERRFRQYGDVRIEPDSVWISGPANLLDTIERVDTEHWVAEGLRRTVSEWVPIQLPGDSRLITLEEELVLVSVPVEEFTEASRTLPLNIVCPDRRQRPDIRLFPSTTEVHYLVALRDYQDVSADMFSASVRCPDSQVDENGRLSIRLDSSPGFVDVLYLRPAAVEYIILE